MLTNIVEFFQSDLFWTVTQTLLDGMATAFEVFILTLVFALPLGLVIALASMSKFKPLRYLMQVIGGLSAAHH